jgi:hypothetical protein
MSRSRWAALRSPPVARAHLVALQGGRCVVTASLGFEGKPLVSRQAVLDPVVTVPLGSGMALLPERASAHPILTCA